MKESVEKMIQSLNPLVFTPSKSAMYFTSNSSADFSSESDLHDLAEGIKRNEVTNADILSMSIESSAKKRNRTPMVRYAI